MGLIERYWRITVDGYHDWTADESAANVARTNGYEVVGPYVLEPSTTRGAVEDARRLGAALRALLDKHGDECGVCVEAEQALPSTTTGEQ